MKYSKMSDQVETKNLSWMTDAYLDFQKRICVDYLICNQMKDFDQIEKDLKMVSGNSTQFQVDLMCMVSCLIPPLCIPLQCMTNKFCVDNKHFALVTCDDGAIRETKIYGPGHHILSMYKTLQGIYSFESFGHNNLIESTIGDIKLAKVEQGTIMHFEFGGQNIILGPGIHLINEPLTFIKVVSLDSFYIEIGPENWVTIPDGYDGISVNRGSIRILPGGKQHHLAHVADKFVKLIPRTLLTDRITSDVRNYVLNLQNQVKQNPSQNDETEFLITTTLDGSPVILDAMIFWRISDSYLAATTAMEILVEENTNNVTIEMSEINVIKAAQNNIQKLRIILLRIAKLHLTAQVGKCSLAGLSNSLIDDFSQKLNARSIRSKKKDTNSFDILNVLQKSTNSIKDAINLELNQIGAHMDNMCIYSVRPMDEIQVELDKQTKAKVDGNTAIISVTAKQHVNDVELEIDSNVQKTRAQINYDVQIMHANAQAQCEVIVADGQSKGIEVIADARQNESHQLQDLPLGQELARLRVSGEIGEKIFKGGNNSFVFGQNPGDVLHSMIMGKKK